MKTRNTQTACNSQNRPKTGFFTVNKIFGVLHLSNVAQLTVADPRHKTVAWASPKAEETFRTEAELKKESARTHAYPYLIR